MTSLAVASEVLQWGVLVLLVGLVAGMSYLIADINRRLGPDAGVLVPNDGVGLNEEAPRFSERDARTGVQVQVAETSEATVLVFLSPTCGPCIDLVPDINRLAKSRKALQIIAVIGGEGGHDYGKSLAAEVAMLVDRDLDLNKKYGVQRTPLVFVIDGTGKVAMRSVANDFVDLEDTLDGIGQLQGASAWHVTA
jgi:thiol-disulfide isomerase/thioredoxin